MKDFKNLKTFEQFTNEKHEQINEAKLFDNIKNKIEKMIKASKKKINIENIDKLVEKIKKALKEKVGGPMKIKIEAIKLVNDVKDTMIDLEVELDGKKFAYSTDVKGSGAGFGK
jgi:hypothetical protein